jgi:Xaa-Pro aminopeptidase
MPDVLIYGDTERSAALRHEVPIGIGDAFLYLETGGRQVILTNALERDRIARALPEAELLMPEELGLYELIAEGMAREDISIEIAARAVQRAGVQRASVPGDLPVVIADRLRADGVVLDVDVRGFHERRRRKNPAELAGIRRAQRAAQEGMAAGAALLRRADIDGDRLVVDGDVLTAEAVRATIREACAAAGSPATQDLMVVSTWSGGGHDNGSGPLPANLPIVIDLWPQDEQTACWADMTRTFLVGDVPPRVAELAGVVREALEAARRLAAPGVTGRALYEAAADVVEGAGYPTQRTRTPGETLTQGFYFSLGHGVGLEVHEAPLLGLAGHDELLAGDVIAMEPGIEGLPDLGGVRYEDLLLITPEGAETLTDFPYALTP